MDDWTRFEDFIAGAEKRKAHQGDHHFGRWQMPLHDLKDRPILARATTEKHDREPRNTLAE